MRCLRESDVERTCVADAQARKLLRDAIARLALSARSFHRVLKVARTHRGPGQAAEVRPEHVAEALQYRASLGAGA